MTPTEIRKLALEAADEVMRVLHQCQGLEHATFSRSLISDPIAVAIKEALARQTA